MLRQLNTHPEHYPERMYVLVSNIETVQKRTKFRTFLLVSDSDFVSSMESLPKIASLSKFLCVFLGVAKIQKPLSN